MTTAARDAKRKQILAAARQLFTESGFDGTSTDAISDRAHVSKETLYRYYRSKEELLVAVMREMTVERVLPPTMALPTARTHEDVEATVTRVLDAALDQFSDPVYVALCRLAFGESGRRPQLIELFRETVPRAGSQALQAFLEDARQHDLLRADLDVGVAARLLVSPVLAWGLLDGMMAGPKPAPRPSREVLERTVRLLLEGMAPRPAAEP
jgi:AcrR family transcriptional regulator